MVKYALPWQHQSRKRQLIANGTILTLICLGLFYYSLVFPPSLLLRQLLLAYSVQFLECPRDLKKYTTYR